MNAKKLTMAVSFMMVLAAAFVLVVPSDSEAADGFEIVDAKFLQGQKDYYVEVDFSEGVVDGSYLNLYFGEELLKKTLIKSGAPFVRTPFASVETPLEEGTYDVYVTFGKETLHTQIVWPTPSEHTITVLPAEGGKVSVDKSVAYPGETITVSYTVSDTYEFVALYVAGKPIEGNTFEMPNDDVTVTGLFKQVMYEVTFMFNESMQYGEKQSVASEKFVEKPEDPSVIGADFLGWFLEGSEVAFDFDTPVEDNLVLYAHFGKIPAADQTSKLVASMVYDEDGVTLVATAYDDNVIGKGTATVTVLQEVDFFGLKAYVEVGAFTIDFDTSESYAYQNISEEASEYITESGNYAMVADIVLDNKTIASSNYIVFDIEINEQA